MGIEAQRSQKRRKRQKGQRKRNTNSVTLTPQEAGQDRRRIMHRLARRTAYSPHKMVIPRTRGDPRERERDDQHSPKMKVCLCLSPVFVDTRRAAFCGACVLCVFVCSPLCGCMFVCVCRPPSPLVFVSHLSCCGFRASLQGHVHCMCALTLYRYHVCCSICCDAFALMMCVILPACASAHSHIPSVPCVSCHILFLPCASLHPLWAPSFVACSYIAAI